MSEEGGINECGASCPDAENWKKAGWICRREPPPRGPCHAADPTGVIFGIYVCPAE